MERTELAEYVFDTYKHRCCEMLLARGDGHKDPPVAEAPAEPAGAKSDGHHHHHHHKHKHEHLAEHHNDMTGEEFAEVMRGVFSDKEQARRQTAALEEGLGGDIASKYVRKQQFVEWCQSKAHPGLQPWTDIQRELRMKLAGNSFWEHQEVLAKSNRLMAGNKPCRRRIVFWILRPLPDGEKNKVNQYDDHPGHKMDGGLAGAGLAHSPHEQHKEHKHRHSHHIEGHTYPESDGKEHKHKHHHNKKEGEESDGKEHKHKHHHDKKEGEESDGKEHKHKHHHNKKEAEEVSDKEHHVGHKDSVLVNKERLEALHADGPQPPPGATPDKVGGHHKHRQHKEAGGGDDPAKEEGARAAETTPAKLQREEA
jgi:hypothetical protein